MHIGPYELKVVEMGRFRLDGGAMFGHVPKALWSRDYPADDQNRIALALRCLYLEGMGRRILIDTGMGDKWDDKARARFCVEQPGGLYGGLAEVGVEPEQITDVLLTHLHFDHAGGATRYNEDGELEPAFPNAMYHVQRRNLEWARKRNVKERASYLPENFEPLVEADRLLLYDGPRDILPGIQAVISNGHTEGLQVIRITDEQQALYYCADLIPTHAHVHLPFCMGYDNSALQVIEEKEALLHGAAEHGHWVMFEHDPRYAASRVQWNGRKFEAVDLQESL